MTEPVRIVAPIRRVASLRKIACGSCKGTGVSHHWRMPVASYEPTGGPCPVCDGTGVAPIVAQERKP